MTYPEFLAARKLMAEAHIGVDLRRSQRRELAELQQTETILRERGMVG
jgi:hypothetical protein